MCTDVRVSPACPPLPHASSRVSLVRSAQCPADVLRPDGFVCRASLGDCDPQETCNGVAKTCPADARSAATVECRAGDLCDPAENCDGTNAAVRSHITSSGLIRAERE